jgi:SAM-dependent methyltransferase
MNADEQRALSHERWQRAAAGWGRRQAFLRALSAPVSHWMVEAINPQPGQDVLELAAGPGETGFLAAELIVPGGKLVCSDRSEAMLDVARARARELGLSNVEFKVIDAEWIDLEVANVDAVLCRWGYMLMPDPAAALRETRRVLRPGGRLALAVWDGSEANPWVAVPGQELQARGWTEPPPREGPGMFALADQERLRAVLEDAGLTDVAIEAVDLTRRYPSLDDWWEIQLDLSIPLAEAVAGRSSDELADLRAALGRRMASFAGSGGELNLPARSVVATARA